MPTPPDPDVFGAPAVGPSTPSEQWQPNWTRSRTTAEPGEDAPSAPGSQDTAAAGGARLPRVSLPTGGGAIRAVDEKLNVNQATGAAALTVPVYLSAARQGFTPSIG